MILEVALNLASQILFFIVVVYLIPWLGRKIIDKNRDIKKMREKYDQCEDEEKKKRLEKQIEMYGHFLDTVVVIQSWTTYLWRSLASYIVMLVTFNHPRLKTRVGKGEVEEDLGNIYLFKGELYCNYMHDNTKLNWYNPIKMIGVYLQSLVHVLLRPAIAVVLFYFMLPSTTSSIISGFAQWGFANGNIGNIEFLTSIYNGFIDIAWNRFFLGGFAENPVLMIVFLVVFALFFSDSFIAILVDGKLISNLFCLPMVVAIFVAFNAIFAILSPVAYVSVAHYINMVGVAVLYVILIKEIACTVVLCFQWAIRTVIDKLLPF
jgi:hypothetical protein